MIPKAETHDGLDTRSVCHATALLFGVALVRAMAAPLVSGPGEAATGDGGGLRWWWRFRLPEAARWLRLRSWPVVFQSASSIAVWLAWAHDDSGSAASPTRQSLSEERSPRCASGAVLVAAARSGFWFGWAIGDDIPHPVSPSSAQAVLCDRLAQTGQAADAGAGDNIGYRLRHTDRARRYP